MILDVVTKGTTDYSCTIRIVDSSDGTPETGVVYNTAGIDLWYRRPGAAHSSITEATQTEGGAHTDGGFVHISDGYYRLDLPDAAVASGVDYVDVGGTVTGMVVIGGRIRLTDVDLDDAVRGGMTALPNANADAAGGLPISDAGGLDMDGLSTVTTAQVNAECDTAIADAALATASALSTVDGNVDAILVDTNELQGDWADGGRLDLLIDSILSRLTAARAGYLDNLNGHVAQTGDSFARIGANGASLTDLATAAAVAALNNLSTADIDARLAAIGLDHLISASVAGSDVADDSIVAQLVSSSGTADWDDYDNTTDSLQAINDDPEVPAKNTALNNIPVYLVLSSDAQTPSTGRTVTVERSLDGGAFSTATGTITEVSDGLYQFDASAADMNGDFVVFKFTATATKQEMLSIRTDGGS